MRINLFVAVLEHDEVMKLWEKSKELSHKAVVKTKPYVQKAVVKTHAVVEQAKPFALRAAEEALCLTTNALQATANFSRDKVACGLENVAYKLADVHDRMAEGGK